MTVVVASLMFASLLSPALALLVVVAWLCGAHELLFVPVAIWLTATLWLSANASVRHCLRQQRFLDALTDAPLDVLDQMGRLVGWRRRGLRAL